MNENKVIVKGVSTKMTMEHDAVTTVLSIDFNTLTVEDVYEIAAAAAVIKWQNNIRKADAIPAEATYIVPKPGTRSAADPMQSLIAKAGSVEAAIEMLQERARRMRVVGA